MAPPAARSTAEPRRGFPLLRVGGIQVRIDASWLLIFALVLWSLSAGYFPRQYPELDAFAYGVAGLVATLLFFLSILLHELSHSFVARAAGIEVHSITLFLFGGVSEMESDPESPGTEVRVAIVGPLASLALAGLFWALHRWLGGTLPPIAAGILLYLAWINGALAVFNLLPGFPLDGGRVFRAVAWWRTGSLTRATKLASDVGKGFALALMVLGAIQIFGGALVGGLWFILIGLFLRGMAEAGYQTLVIKNALSGVSVEEVMSRDVVSVPAELPLDELIDDYFVGRGMRGFPVVEGGRVRGLIGVADVADVPRERRSQLRVSDAMRPLKADMRIEPGASLTDALRRLAAAPSGRLLVMRGDDVAGILTRTGLARFLEIRRVLEPGAEG
jgi:Zn-dependent protease/CBS domain-containing protein